MQKDHAELTTVRTAQGSLQTSRQLGPHAHPSTALLARQLLRTGEFPLLFPLARSAVASPGSPGSLARSCEGLGLGVGGALTTSASLVGFGGCSAGET